MLQANTDHGVGERGQYPNAAQNHKRRAIVAITGGSNTTIDPLKRRYDAERPTVQAGKMNAVSSGPQAAPAMSALEQAAAAAQAQMNAIPATDIKFCAIDDPGCEACQ